MTTKPTFAILALVASASFVGCTNPGREERETYSHDFQTNLTAETSRVIDACGGTLSLSNAVALAHERTLKLASRDLEIKLAEVKKAMIFSAFLPTVAFSGSGTLLNGGIYDTSFGDITTDGSASLVGGSMMVAQPVFTPVAWVMYAEARYGVRIQEIVRKRAGQLLDVQVAARFYQAAVADRTVSAYSRQLESGVALTNRLVRLVDSGYALASDLARAEARCAVASAQLRRAENDRDSTRAALADILRLWPLAVFGIDGDSLLALPPLPERDAAEWIWEGLVTRLDLYAGDQTLELRKARVIEALANFLPNVVLGGGGATASLKDIALRGWAGSLVGTWAAFEGFRSVQAYRAAKAERETEFKLQEDRMLAVVVAVADAWRNRATARERRAAAETWARAAKIDHAMAERRFEDGQETFSTVLDKLAVRDEAEVKAAAAAYAEALADIQLRQAVGLDLFSKVGQDKVGQDKVRKP